MSHFSSALQLAYYDDQIVACDLRAGLRVCDGNTWMHLIGERESRGEGWRNSRTRRRREEAVGEFRWMWCGDGAGKKR